MSIALLGRGLSADEIAKDPSPASTIDAALAALGEELDRRIDQAAMGARRAKG